MIGEDPGVSESNRLHVVMFRFFFINLRYIPYIDSFKMISHSCRGLELQPVFFLLKFQPVHL